MSYQKTGGTLAPAIQNVARERARMGPLREVQRQRPGINADERTNLRRLPGVRVSPKQNPGGLRNSPIARPMTPFGR